MDPELGEVERSDLVKGYEVEKGKYILLDKQDLDAVKLESTRVIDIEKFVALNAIDRLYWNDPYYLIPSGKTGIEAFGVIRRAMQAQAKIALGRLVVSTRERTCAIEPRGEGMLLTTLRSHDEVLDMEEAGGSLKVPKPDKRMLDIAEKIIDQQAGDFDPSHFTDRYEDALRKLIAEKRKGKPVRVSPPEENEGGGKVVDLMQALRRSLHGDGASQRRADRYLEARSRAKPPARKTSVRKPRTRSGGKAA